MKKKKPTIKEIQKVIDNLILAVVNLEKRVNNLDFVLGTYHEWKNEKEKFREFLHEKVEELNKNRTDNSVSDK